MLVCTPWSIVWNKISEQALFVFVFSIRDSEFNSLRGSIATLNRTQSFLIHNSFFLVIQLLPVLLQPRWRHQHRWQPQHGPPDPRGRGREVVVAAAAVVVVSIAVSAVLPSLLLLLMVLLLLALLLALSVLLLPPGFVLFPLASRVGSVSWKQLLMTVSC